MFKPKPIFLTDKFLLSFLLLFPSIPHAVAQIGSGANYGLIPVEQTIPQMTIFSPNSGTITAGTVVVTVTVRVPQNTSLETVSVFLNGELLNKRAIFLDNSTAANLSFEYPLKNSGNYQFRFVAINNHGESTIREVLVERPQKPSETYGVIIGINNYKDDSIKPDLQFAVNDADEFYEWLKSNYNLKESFITKFINEEATARRMKSYIKDMFPNSTDENDNLFIYFAGHGAVQKDSNDPGSLKTYLLPYDTVLDELDVFGFSVSDFHDILKKDAKNIIIIIDACFSGAAVGGGEGKRVINNNQIAPGKYSLPPATWNTFLPDSNSQSKGRLILAATQPNGVAHEGKHWKHGVFTYHLLAGLRGLAKRVQDQTVKHDETTTFIDHVEITDYIDKELKKLSLPNQTLAWSANASGKSRIILGRVTKSD